MVDGILAAEQQLRHGKHTVALGYEPLYYPRQSLGGVQRCVVEQNYAPLAHPGQHPLLYLRRTQILPIQTVPIGSSWKALALKNPAEAFAHALQDLDNISFYNYSSVPAAVPVPAG